MCINVRADNSVKARTVSLAFQCLHSPTKGITFKSGLVFRFYSLLIYSYIKFSRISIEVARIIFFFSGTPAKV